jgi:uncharacterized protein YbaA (DUF1428 family)
MSYIQGFLLAVPKVNKQAYIQSAQSAAPIFLEYGATRIMESWSENIADGKVTDFKRAVKAKDDEAIIFSWIEWPDKNTFDAAAKKMETDPRWKEMPDMPFDATRMIWGGFEPIFQTGE